MAQVNHDRPIHHQFLHPNDTELQWVQRMCSGQALLKQHRCLDHTKACLEEALDFFRSAQELDINAMQTYAFLSETYLLMGQFALGKQTLQKGLRCVGLSLLDVKKNKIPAKLWTHQSAEGLQALAHLLCNVSLYHEHVDSPECALAILNLIPVSVLSSSAGICGVTCSQLQWYKAVLNIQVVKNSTHWADRFMGATRLLVNGIKGWSYFKKSQAYLFPTLLWRVVAQFSDLYRYQSSENETYLFETLEAIHDHVPGWTTIHNLLGLLCAGNYNDNEASYWFQRSLYRNPLNYDALVGLGIIAKSSGHMSQAEDYFKRSLLIHPNQPDVMYELAQIEAMHQNLESAMISYQGALQLTDDAALTVDIYKDLAQLYIEVDVNAHHDKLVSLYQMIVDLEPHSIENYMQLASLYFDEQQYPLAEEVFLQGLQVSPSNSPLLCSLAYVYWMQDNTDSAIETYQQAIEADPEYDVPYNNLGVIYLDEYGNAETAKPYFESALLYNPQYAMAYYNLGRCHQKMGDSLQAAQAYQQSKMHCMYDGELSLDTVEQALLDLFKADSAA